MSVARRVGIAAGTLGGVAGLAYGVQRLAATRMRRAPDGDARRALEAPGYVDHRLETHDRGTIYVVERGDELDPPIVLSHGVTLSVRTWFHQLEELPKEGFRAIAFDHRGHGRSVLGQEGHSLENLGRDLKTVLEGLDLHGAVLVGHSMGGVAVQSFVTRFPEVAAERVAGIVLRRPSRTHRSGRARPAPRRASSGSRNELPTRNGCGTHPIWVSSRRASASARTRARATLSSCAR